MKWKSRRMNIIFMGTPDFSVGTLKALVEEGHHISLVVTQPDKPKGRGNQMQMPPVKEYALQHEIPVFQPDRIRKRENMDILFNYQADLIVVVAYGQLLPKEILDYPKHGCMNVHASLLPKYRGAAPIQWAILNGEKVTGVTIMRMEEGLDTGPIILQKEYRILEQETGGSLFEQLMTLGAQACIQAIELFMQGLVTFTKQDHEHATHTSMIHKKLGELCWKADAIELERKIRGLNPWPSAFTYWSQKTVKIWSATVVSDKEEWSMYAPGTVCEVQKDGFFIRTGKGSLFIKELQLEGKKRMFAEEFLRGNHVNIGDCFGK